MNQAIIALGGNMGDVQKSFDGAYLALSETHNIIARSMLYQTPALTAEGAEPQADYLNAAIKILTNSNPSDLLQELHLIEATLGRERLEHWGARTLDLDLLAYDDLISDSPTLKLPHPRIAERLFVLQPLSDIEPDWIHPVTNSDVSTMIQSLVNKKASLFEGIAWTNV